MRTGLIGLALLGSLLGLGCGGKNETARSTGKLNVVTTTGMIADLVRNIGGDQVTVTALMGPGIDPHMFKASQGDIARLANAKIVFYNGLDLEGKITKILQKMSRNWPTIAITDGVEKSRLLPSAEIEGHYDPHIWFDVSLWMQAAQFVQHKLAEIDSIHAPVYQANGQAYLEQLEQLHQWTLEQIQQIAPDRRLLITAHDAFGYFGHAYGIRVMGLQGISTVAEYGVNDVTRMVDLIIAEKIPAIFVESSIPLRSIEAIVAGCRARGHAVKIGGTLYSDAMGTPGSDADTFIKMVQHNVRTIVQALR